MDLVNIVMATYNGEKYISEQIESIINSYYKNWVLWIFDDGSTDRTSSIIKEFSNKYPDKIRYYKNEKNLGVTRNFLIGLNVAADCQKELQNLEEQNIESYYMFCDQDDVWMPDKIEKTLKHIKKIEKKYGRSTAASVFTDALIADESLNVLYTSFNKRSKLNTKKMDLPHLMMENKVIGCTLMMNQALQNKLSNIPEHARFHDWWIALATVAFGHISYLPEPTLYYRQHSKNVVGNQSFFSYVKGRFMNLHKQKEVILQTSIQAEEFYKIYQAELNHTQEMQVYAMAHLPKYSWVKRRVRIFQYGFFKTGIIRNIGLLYII